MITEDQMADLIEQFENDTWDWREWDGMENPERVFVMVPMTLADAERLDDKAHKAGLSRAEYLRRYAIA